ncbi:uncharacterized protein LOC132304501 isoform X1 [Cornus florida]|uniref:uncharacterized protein LOC132304501 isoform X1 n=1 Tax=Cornus florida TaxID=4283 RepID=UPI0028A21E4E|nr:uncharacterized protein LOC132304501 isoform X1 [Cornus florida]XP_059658189.1 uncharacterized protein LOC132304501 isoform X1 [Cornus florida]
MLLLTCLFSKIFSQRSELMGMGGAVKKSPTSLHIWLRFYTRFSPDQTSMMVEFAEQIGWNCRSQEKQVEEFCILMKIEKRVFNSWIYNKKKKYNESPHLKNNHPSKRINTKLNLDQRATLLKFAEKIGWKMQGNKGEFAKFCSKVELDKSIIWRWLYNHKREYSGSHPPLENKLPLRRTKFTPDQKAMVLQFADQIGWNLRGKDTVVTTFSLRMEREKKVVKNWVYSNKCKYTEPQNAREARHKEEDCQKEETRKTGKEGKKIKYSRSEETRKTRKVGRHKKYSRNEALKLWLERINTDVAIFGLVVLLVDLGFRLMDWFSTKKLKKRL